MTDDIDTYIDTDDGTMYAVSNVDDDDGTATVVKATRTEMDVDELEERVDAGELLSPSQLQERIEAVLDGFEQGLALYILNKLIDGEDPEEMDVPDVLAELLTEVQDDDEEDEDPAFA